MTKQELFTKRLRKLIYEGEYSQADLAEKLGCTRASVSTWATGRSTPKTDVLEKLAKIYDVPVDYFFGDETVETVTYESNLKRVIEYSNMLLELKEKDRELIMSLIEALKRR